MLLALGRSGMPDALSLLQTHAQSPIGAIRRHGRRALQFWLVAHGHLGHDDELPDPPHRFYTEPAATLSTADVLPSWVGPLPPPEPTGVPAGMRVDTQRRWSLFGTGLGVLLSMYTASSLTNAAVRGSGEVYIPIVGAFIGAAKVFDGESPDGIAAMAILSGVSQVAGLSLVIVGVATTENHLRTAPLHLHATPGGVTLSGSF